RRELHDFSSQAAARAGCREENHTQEIGESKPNALAQEARHGHSPGAAQDVSARDPLDAVAIGIEGIDEFSANTQQQRRMQSTHNEPGRPRAEYPAVIMNGAQQSPGQPRLAHGFCSGTLSSLASRRFASAAQAASPTPCSMAARTDRPGLSCGQRS